MYIIKGFKKLFDKILYGNGYYLGDYASLSALVTTISTDKAFIVVDTDDTLAANLTIPANISIKTNSGVIDPSIYTLTIAGKILGNDQIFPASHSGSISLTNQGVVAVELFGAVADNSTDNTNALNTAKTTCFMNGNEMLLASVGTYKYSNTLNFYGTGNNQGGVNLKGKSQIKTILYNNSANQSIQAGAQNYRIAECEFSDFTLKSDYDYDTTETGGGHGLKLTGSFNVIKRVKFNNLKNALELGGGNIDSEAVGAWSNTVKNNYFYKNAENIIMYNNANAVQIINNWINRCTGYGIKFYGCMTALIQGNNIEHSGEQGIYHTAGSPEIACRGVEIKNNHFEANGEKGTATEDILIDKVTGSAECSKLIIQNNYCWSGLGQGIYVNRINSAIVQNNHGDLKLGYEGYQVYVGVNQTVSNPGATDNTKFAVQESIDTTTYGKVIRGIVTGLALCRNAGADNFFWYCKTPGNVAYGEQFLKGRFIMQQITAEPTLVQNTQLGWYMKGTKLIFSFNHNGTVKYRYLDMTSTDATWTYTTTAP